MELICWSDGCIYQNRNAALSSALLRLATSYKVDIYQKYLEVGHSHMEVDSVHAKIEGKLKHRSVNVPADYSDIIKQARSNPFPYKVKNEDLLNYKFFKNYEKISAVRSIRPGRHVGGPTVTDIRQIKYTKEGEIKLKLNHSDTEWLALEHRYQVPTELPETLYKQSIKIVKNKFQHLQELKKTIHSDYHSYYDQLPHVEQ